VGNKDTAQKLYLVFGVVAFSFGVMEGGISFWKGG
jgi:hypothetical protein